MSSFCEKLLSAKLIKIVELTKIFAQYNKNQYLCTEMMNMNNSTLVIGVLARNCIDGLRNNISRIEELGGMFKEYHVIVYENDSTDGTKECIMQWVENNGNVVAICEDLNQVTIPNKSKYILKPSKSEWRIQKMASFRNRVLQEVNKRFSPDYFCFLDVDIESFSPQSVVEAMKKAPDDWGALCASGHLYYSNPNGTDYPANFQYDAYAFFPEGSKPEEMGRWVISHQCHLVSAWTAEELVRKQKFASCRSAFNGLAVYKWNVIKDLHYKVMQNKELKECGAAMCEHLPFHSDIILRGKKCYITGIMEVVYMHKKNTFLRCFNNWLDVYIARIYRGLLKYNYQQ